jgi:hypothetical protein
VMPPEAVAPVVDPPLLPEDASPMALPFEPPLEPPLDVPEAGPLLPLPVALVLVAAAGAGGGGVDEGPFLRAASNARLEIRPVTAGHGRRCGVRWQPFGTS